MERYLHLRMVQDLQFRSVWMILEMCEALKGVAHFAQSEFFALLLDASFSLDAREGVVF